MENERPFPKAYLALPLLIAALLYSAGLSSTDLWTPDEPRYAQIAREMVDSGNYVQPHCNGEPYTEKPPLFFWTIALGAKVFGEVNQLAVRLPSVLSALGTLLLLIVFLNKLFGRRVAFLSALLLSTSPEFFWLARSGHIDMLLTLLVTAALLSFYRWYAGGGRLHLVVFYACLALATLAKGPVGMALPLMTALCFLLVRKEWSRINQMRLYVGLPAALGVVLAWYLPATQQSTGYDVGPMVLQQIIGRIFNPTCHTVNVFYWPFYQLASLAWGMAPWSLLVPWAAVAAYRSRGDAPHFFLLCWGAVIMAFFTLIATKRELYILPMYPAATALIALWVVRSAPSSNPKPIRVMSGLYGVALLLILAAAAALAPAYLRKEYPEIAIEFDWRVMAVMAIWAAAGGIAAAAAFSRKRWAGIAACAAASVATFALLIGSVLPWVDQHKSPRNICDAYNSAKAPDSEIAMLGRAREEYVFYVNGRITPLKNALELKRFFDTGKQMYCFVREKDYKSVLDTPDLDAYVVVRERVSSRVMLLLCNREEPASPE